MIATAVAPCTAPVAAKAVVGRKSFSGLPVAPRVAKVQCRVNRSVVASAQKEKLAAAVTVGVATMMANPLYAEATTVSPSLKNLLLSVLSGVAVLAVIATAVTGVSQFDKIDR